MADAQDTQPLLENQQKQLGLVIAEGDSIDTKALAILAANVAIVIFINQTTNGQAAWEYLLLYGPFILSLILDVLSVWPRRYRGPGVTTAKLPEYLTLAREQLLLQLLSDTQAAIRHNSKLNRQRLRWCVVSIILTGFGFTALLFIL